MFFFFLQETKCPKIVSDFWAHFLRCVLSPHQFPAHRFSHKIKTDDLHHNRDDPGCRGSRRHKSACHGNSGMLHSGKNLHVLLQPLYWEKTRFGCHAGDRHGFTFRHHCHLCGSGSHDYYAPDIHQCRWIWRSAGSHFHPLCRNKSGQRHHGSASRKSSAEQPC